MGFQEMSGFLGSGLGNIKKGNCIKEYMMENGNSWINEEEFWNQGSEFLKNIPKTWLVL